MYNFQVSFNCNSKTKGDYLFMNESFEMILTIVIFGIAALLIVGLMVYWGKNNTVVDERDKKYYQNKDSKN